MNNEVLPIITIDGPAGVGKTTLARMLSEDLDIPCLDTGAMFRFVALELGGQGLALADDELDNRLAHLDFKMHGTGKNAILYCNNIPTSDSLRTEEISSLASRLSARLPVRKRLLQAQQEIGNSRALVTEGRDMGTAIFPAAALKFYLDASPQIRARRRWQQLREKGENISLNELEENIRARDNRDLNRELAPLKAAPDAILINTDNLDLAQAYSKIRSMVEPYKSLFKRQ